MTILGPVFWYEIIRIARRQRLALWRGGYGLALLLILLLIHRSWFPEAGFLELFGGHTTSPRQAAGFATAFFVAFAALQFLAVGLLTPAWTASSLAEERESHTITFLLTSQLTGREIGLGKLASRLLQLGLLLLTGLPVLGLLQMMGGIDPLLLISTYAALFLTALSLGGLGLLSAVYTRKAENAAWRPYQLMLLYLALSTVLMWAMDMPVSRRTPWGWRFAGGGGAWTAVAALNMSVSGGPTLGEDIVELLNSGNPFYAASYLYYGSVGHAEIADMIPGVLGPYAIFHGLIAIGSISLACAQLRRVSARHVTGLPPKKAIPLQPAPHPPVGERPVLWKEVYCDSQPRRRWLRLLFGRWGYVASFLPGWIVIVFGLNGDYRNLAELMHGYLTFVATLMVLGMFVRIMVHAARSVNREREAGTFDALLTTLIPRRQILIDKWVGSVWLGRWTYLWLVIHWCYGMLVLMLHPLAAINIALQTIVVAAAIASLGIYCATRFRTTRAAVQAALIITLLSWTLAPWFAAQLIRMTFDVREPPIWQRSSFDEIGNSVVSAIQQTMCPPYLMVESIVPYMEQSYYYEPIGHETRLYISLATGAFALLVYGIVAFVLRQLAIRRFMAAVEPRMPRRAVAS